MVFHCKLHCLKYRLVEEGKTALGPALLMSVAIASRVPGSTVSYQDKAIPQYTFILQVILCTDGLANVGLGKLDGNPDSYKLLKKTVIQNVILFL